MNNISDRPSIYICSNNPEEFLLKEIAAGIEEEGLPYLIKDKNFNKGDIVKEAYICAQESRIGIAVGIFQNNIVLHYNKLKEDKPLFNINVEDGEKSKARFIGCNAARLYKVMPFKNLGDRRDLHGKSSPRTH